MPIFRTADKLVYYAHVPKCGGSAVAWYLRNRFGTLAFSDNQHTRHSPAGLWSRTSPQHIDRQSLERLFPAGFFDASFTIVRHPVPRLVSAYHFQLEVEKRIPESTSFSEWLEDIAEMRLENPFLHDNHVRPMTEIVPADAQVFHMEHGLDGLIPWFDHITGTKAAPRAIPRINKRGEHTGTKSAQVTPSKTDLARIADLYGDDFTRFGYSPEDTGSTTRPAPTLSEAFKTERDQALRTMNNPITKLKSRLATRLKG